MPFIALSSLPSKEVVPGYVGRAVHTGMLTFMYWTVTEGAIMPVHAHLHEQTAQVLSGTFELSVNNETQLLEPGMIAVIPPFQQHGGRAITACELLDVFYPEREDYKFEQ